MSTTFKKQMREVMNDAWRLFRVTGETFAECLKKAWILLKLKIQMKTKPIKTAIITKINQIMIKSLICVGCNFWFFNAAKIQKEK